MEVFMVGSSRPTLAIVGAGAGGVLLASALAKPGRLFDVVLVDPRPGRGVAFGSADEELLLNTPAGAMSLDPESPGGFLQWLNTYRSRQQPWTPEDFVSRRLFGDYLADRLRNLEARPPGLGATRAVAARVETIERHSSGWFLHLSSRERLAAGVVVLATGPARPRALIFNGRDQVEAYVQDDPWDEAGVRRAASGGDVLLVGSALTAADVAAAIWRRDPDRRVIALSRHGLAPRTHAPAVPGSPRLCPPYPSTARELFTRLCNSAGFTEEEPKVRRGVFAGLNEIGGQLWARLPEDERRMFLRHFRPYWDVERHRLAPALGATLEQAFRDGRFQLTRGRLAEAKPLKDGSGARVALLTNTGPRALTVGLIINCTGPESDPYRSRNPLLLDLLAQGIVSADPLGLGLRVDEDGAAIDATSEVSPDLYAMGALTQGRFFEITAIPDIRRQAAHLAERIAAPFTARAHPAPLALAAGERRR
jgi:uncharacterized NAD(P)/FAD-binding protein YdhS